MATNKNITMKQFNGVDYDTLYPKTIAEQVDGIYGKDEVLSNNTKALYGLTDSAVPDDALALLSRFNSGLGNEYVWEKLILSAVEGAEKAFVSILNTNNYTFYDTVSFSTSGEFLLNNPNTFQGKNAPVGKYYKNNNEIYLITRKSSSDTYTSLYGKLISKKYEVAGYVNSPNSNTYPSGSYYGEYFYNLIGRLGEKLRVTTGSYTGTKTRPSSYSTIEGPTLTLGLRPILFICLQKDQSNSVGIMLTPNSQTASGWGGNGSISISDVKFIDETVTWIGQRDTAANGMNYSGIKYTGIAFGF